MSVRTLESSGIDIGGQSATLEIAGCVDRRPCNRIRWSVGGCHYTVVGRLPADELVRLAQSMGSSRTH